MAIRYAIVFLLMSGTALGAQGLSATDCAEIKNTYGIVPEGCKSTASVDIKTSELPTAKQMENNVFFPKGGAKLDASAQALVTKLGKILNSSALINSCLRLEGHSDTSGAESVNQALASRRVEAVRTALSPLLSDPKRIVEVKVRGETAPMVNLLLIAHGNDVSHYGHANALAMQHNFNIERLGALADQKLTRTRYYRWRPVTPIGQTKTLH